MPDPNIDANVSHQIYVERLATTNANSIDGELKALATYVRARLADEGRKIESKAALNKLVADVRNRFGSTYDTWVAGTGVYLNELSEYETEFQTKIINMQTVDEFDAVAPSAESTEREVRNTPMAIGANGGSVAVAALLGNFSKSETDKTLAVIKTGYYQGERISDISASITGTRANKYADGVIASTKRNAKAVSRTSSDHVTNVAKSNVYKRNQKAVQGYILTAVLDSKTSKTCRGLDDKEVLLSDDYKPKPPFHVNCRTVMRPLLRDDLDRIKRAKRQTIGASGKEYEPTGKQYYTWLRQQPKSFQDDILGKTEGAIFRNSGLTPQEFKNATINRNGKPLTIAEMAEKDKRIAKYLEL